MKREFISRPAMDLMTPEAVRKRCDEIFHTIEAEETGYFQINLQALEDTTSEVIQEINTNYPSGEIPFHSRWRHFEFQGQNLWAETQKQYPEWNSDDVARARIDLAVISVLLDAGAGPKWSYFDDKTKLEVNRSEGLALASLRLIENGTLSILNLDDPFRVDAIGLETLKPETLANLFQVSADNPLIGIFHRAKLLNQLGKTLRRYPEVFGKKENIRVGYLFDYLRAKSIDGKLQAREILLAILHYLGEIWPNRKRVGNAYMGDIGYHPIIQRDDETNKIVPFHKLSQWMAYSLIEPLQDSGLEIEGLNALTGLAEYRNGGLFIDTNVLKLKNPEDAKLTHRPDSPLIIEWRALTVSLLDRLANRVRSEIGTDDKSLPLTSILQGGTWTAGRRIARQYRNNGSSPLNLDSDGTVF